MKSIRKFNKVYALFILSFFIINSCTKEFEYGDYTKAVKTLESTNVLQTSAIVSGSVVSDNGSQILKRGICYITGYYPTIQNSKKVDLQSTLGNYSCVVIYKVAIITR